MLHLNGYQTHQAHPDHQGFAAPFLAFNCTNEFIPPHPMAGIALLQGFSPTIVTLSFLLFHLSAVFWGLSRPCVLCPAQQEFNCWHSGACGGWMMIRSDLFILGTHDHTSAWKLMALLFPSHCSMLGLNSGPCAHEGCTTKLYERIFKTQVKWVSFWHCRGMPLSKHTTCNKMGGGWGGDGEPKAMSESEHERERQTDRQSMEETGRREARETREVRGARARERAVHMSHSWWWKGTRRQMVVYWLCSCWGGRGRLLLRWRLVLPFFTQPRSALLLG